MELRRHHHLLLRRTEQGHTCAVAGSGKGDAASYFRAVNHLIWANECGASIIIFSAALPHQFSYRSLSRPSAEGGGEEGEASGGGTDDAEEDFSHQFRIRVAKLNEFFK